MDTFAIILLVFAICCCAPICYQINGSMNEAERNADEESGMTAEEREALRDDCSCCVKALKRRPSLEVEGYAGDGSGVEMAIDEVF